MVASSSIRPGLNRDMPMKIVIAPDSYKDNLSSRQVATAIQRGVQRVFPRARCICVAMADGGEGTVTALLSAHQGRLFHKQVSDPIGRKIRASYGWLDNMQTAVIEMAAAAGLPLLSQDERNPLQTTTRGVGELIQAALDRDAKKIIIGIGGSATNDGGCGMAQALGVRFLNKNGRLIRRALSGGTLNQIQHIDMSELDPRIRRSKIIIASDVTNPLCGKQGAAYVFARQKGASTAMIKTLDSNLRHLGKVIERELGKKVISLKGGGAAGGCGAGLQVFLRARMRPGVKLILDMINLQQHLQDADLLITGEGCIDDQTAFGKTPAGVARLGRQWGVPTIAIGGRLSDNAREVFSHGLAGIESAYARDMPLTEALAHARTNIANATERALRLIKIGRNMD